MENLDLLNADGLDDGFLSNSEKIGFKLFKSSNPIDFEVNKSNIHGLGLFAVNPIKKGTVLMPIMKINNEGSIIDECEPQYYMNHLEKNSVIPFKIKDVIWIAASKDIKSNEEILCDYNSIHKLGLTDNLLNFKNYSDNDFKYIMDSIKKNNPKKNRPIGYRYSV